MSPDDFTRATTGFWQEFLPDAAAVLARGFASEPPYRYGYPALLPDGRRLVLPIRRVAGTTDRAVASLIANQAAFEVVRELSAHMTTLARPMNCDVIAGLPTLGMAFAPLVAEQLGQARYVPLGYSRKFWYDEALSASVHSLTTPTQGKRVYIDPNQLPLLAGRRVVIIDDAVSTGSTLAAVFDLLKQEGAEVVGAVVAMRQGVIWRERLGPGRSALVAGVFDSPRLVLRDDGWWPE